MIFFSNVPCHMTMTMPIYGKNLQKYSTSKQEADDLETWYTASGTGELPFCFSHGDPGLTLTIFMTGLNLFPNASAWVKASTALGAHVFPSLF